MVERVIFATDAAQPAATRPFHRLSAEQLPEGASDVRVRLFRTHPPYELGFSPGLWRALHRVVPTADLVTIHSLNLFPQYAAFNAATRAGVPYIVTPHGALDPWLSQNSRRYKRLTNAVWQGRMLKSAAAIHFTTEEEAALAGELTASTPHMIVPNGLDLSRFMPGRPSSPFRARYLGGYTGRVVLFLGRIARKKGIDLLIRAFARSVDVDMEDSMLVVAGPDDECLTSELVGIADSVGIGSRIKFVGAVYGEDQLDALAAADVWALTSHTENFGNAVVEAMAAGCPVLVSTEVNLSGQIRDAEAGVITTLSIGDIADSLRSLLTDADRRAFLIHKGRAFAQRFDWSIIAPELVWCYTDVAERWGRAPRSDDAGTTQFASSEGDLEGPDGVLPNHVVGSRTAEPLGSEVGPGLSRNSTEDRALYGDFASLTQLSSVHQAGAERIHTNRADPAIAEVPNPTVLPQVRSSDLGRNRSRGNLAGRFSSGVLHGPMSRNLGAAVGAQLCLLVSGTLSARLLGPQGRGYVAILTAWPSAVGQLGAVGISLAATYFLSARLIDGPDLIALLRRSASAQIVVLTLVNAAIIMGYVAISHAPILDAALFSLALLPAVLCLDYGIAFLLGARRHGLVAGMRLISPAAYALGLIVLYALHQRSVEPVLALASSAALLAGLVGLRTGLKAARNVRTDDSIVAAHGLTAARKRVLAFGRKGYIGYLSPVDSFRIDLLVVGFLISPRALGLYVVGAAFTNFTRMVAVNVGLSSTPEIAAQETHLQRRHAVRRTLALSAGVLTLVTVALAVVVVFAIPVLFGRAFDSSIPIAEILFVAGWLLAMKRIAVDTMRGAGETRVGTKAELVNLLLFLALCAPFGLLLGGPGVAAALVIASAGGSVVLIRGLRQMGL